MRAGQGFPAFVAILGTCGDLWGQPRLLSFTGGSPRALVTPAWRPDGAPMTVDASTSTTTSWDRWLHFSARGSTNGGEIRGGLVMFVAMDCTVILNPQRRDGEGRDRCGHRCQQPGHVPRAVHRGDRAVRCLIATAMGIVGCVPVALGAGLGVNGVVAFAFAPQLTWADAMGLIVLEALLHSVFVVTDFRNSVFHAVPELLVQAIGVGPRSVHHDHRLRLRRHRLHRRPPHRRQQRRAARLADVGRRPRTAAHRDPGREEAGRCHPHRRRRHAPADDHRADGARGAEGRSRRQGREPQRPEPPPPDVAAVDHGVTRSRRDRAREPVRWLSATGVVAASLASSRSC